MTQKIPSELIADDAIDSEHYADGSIDTAHIAINQITLALMAGGTDGNIISYDASGDPVAIATGDSGEVLTSAGAGNPPAFAAAAGGGVTQADSWRLTTSFSGDADITSNLAQGVGYAGSGFGTLGDGMSESSGAFTFPETGYWQVMAMFQFRCSCDVTDCTGAIRVTVDDTNYTEHTQTDVALAGTHINSYSSIFVYALVDVEDTALVKVKFRVSVPSASVQTYAGVPGQTSFHFIRLGDT